LRRAAFGASSPRGRRTFLFAAPGAGFSAPAALRAALALQGKALRAILAARGLAPLKDRRTGCAGSARNPQPQRNPLPDASGVVRLVLIEP